MKLWTAAAVVLAACVAGLAAARDIERYAEYSAQDISIEIVGGAVGYTPEIGTVQDGVVHDVRATVSADRRYVQMNLQPSVAIIERIDNFMVVTD